MYITKANRNYMRIQNIIQNKKYINKINKYPVQYTNIILIAYFHLILQQCNDIETNPGPKYLSNDKISTIMGTTHQGSIKYFNISELCGSSCMTNSLLAIAYAKTKSIKTWTSHDIDEILQLGIHFYKLLYPNRITKDHSTFLQINDLNTNIAIGNKQFKVKIKQSYCGNI